MCWRNIKMYVFLGIFLIVAVYAGAAYLCKGLLFQGCYLHHDIIPKNYNNTIGNETQNQGNNTNNNNNNTIPNSTNNSSLLG